MSDDEKKTNLVLDEVPQHPMAPAIHTDEVWDGPRWIHHATEKPVYVETKQQYWDLLKENGFRMVDQAESEAKSDIERKPADLPIALTPHPTPRHFAQGEAHLFGAANAVFNGRDTYMFFSCNECYQRNAFHWCECVITAKEVSLTCKCGTRRYVPPRGTTDLFFEKLSNLGLKSEAPGLASITTVGGRTSAVPHHPLSDMEASIIRAFAKMMRGREIELHPFHKGCFQGQYENFENESGLMVSHDEVALMCPCKVHYWRRTHVVSDGSIH